MSQSNTQLSLPLPEIASQFLVDQKIAFFNHGSFGACPKPVFDIYQSWQRELEAQPVNFISRRVEELLAQARQTLGEFVGTTGDNVTFVPNATYGINIVAQTLNLQPDDEVLTTDHEYGAINKTWLFNCEKRGARYVTQEIPFPLGTAEEFVETLWRGVTERTKVIAISHITSPTAIIFPVALVCKRARQEGIITVIDGAHAPGQIDLDMEAIGADYYAGNCHKWLSSPKGAGYLYVDSQHLNSIEPLVVSHGWRENGDYSEEGSAFRSNFAWTGTMDPAAYLSVPAAIEFQQKHDWPAVRAACHRLARQAMERIHKLSEFPYNAPMPDLDDADSHNWWMQMCTARLPDKEVGNLHNRLWTDYQVEVPAGIRHRDQVLIRISMQAYNTPQHVEMLLNALHEIYD